jgi:hypothetical protein
MPFASASLLGQRSLPRIVLAWLVVRLACGLMVTGKRLAPEVFVQG